MLRIATALLAFAACSLAAEAQAKTFVYLYDGSIAGTDDPKIYAFESRGGLLSPVSGSPFDLPDTTPTCTGQCQMLDYSKQRKTLVVSGPSGLSSFLVNKDGSLDLVVGSPFPTIGETTGVATVQLKKRSFAYSAVRALDDLHAFEIGADGTLAEISGSPFDSELHAPSGAIARKRLLFVADEATLAPLPNALASFLIGDDGTPAAAPGSPLELDGSLVHNVTADAKGRFVYLADDATKDDPIRVHAVAIDKRTGAPTLVPGSPFSTTLIGELAAGASAGRGLLAALARESPDPDLALFRTARDGSLTPLGSVKDSNVFAEVHGFGGKFLFVASEDNIVVIAIRKSDGAIDHAPFEPIGTGDTHPVGILVINR